MCKSVEERKDTDMKKLWSIFTDNMNRCIFTGYEDPEGTPYPKIERHHVFESYNRSRSEKYGYVAPLLAELHPNGAKAPKEWQDIDEHLKKTCQQHYEEHHGTREDFIREFGRSYL